MPLSRAKKTAGVDGFKKGWIAVVDFGHGTTAVRTYSTFQELVQDAELDHIVIDIPIGLLERGPRACDVEARKVLGRKRRSSVFPAPMRSMLIAKTWEEACRIGFKREGKKCSKQTAGILPKIREVDRAMTPTLQRRVREGHPEVCFTMMNGGKPMEYRKTTARGRAERLALIEVHFPDVHQHLGEVPASKTDIIDAYACLWTARRIVDDEAICLRKKVEHDAKGLRAEILA